MNTSLEARRPITASINDIVDIAVESVKEFHELRGASIQVETTGRFEAVVIPQTIHTALVNMILNAAETHHQAVILLTLGLSQDESSIILEVHDDGPGVPKHLWSKIFEPNFTTKVFNSGLGLLAVKAAAFVHKGTIEVTHSVRLHGACFRLTIPRNGTLNSSSGITNSPD